MASLIEDFFLRRRTTRGITLNFSFAIESGNIRTLFLVRGFRVLVWVFASIFLCTLLGQAQQKPTILTREELKKVVPGSYFFRGLSGPVQKRNSAAVRFPGGKLVVAALVDTSGYASNVRQTYEGLLITETKVEIGGAAVPPGAYGFAFSKDGTLGVLDMAGEPVILVPTKRDETLRPAVPLSMREHNGEIRFYRGRQYVTVMRH